MAHEGMRRKYTFGQAAGNIVLHALVLPEPVVDVALWQLPALLHHDPGIQELHSRKGRVESLGVIQEASKTRSGPG